MPANSSPKISVIVPVYNVCVYLRECLDSLKAQTYRNLEILLVDDGSTDGSGNICDEYEACDSRFRAFHTENLGVSNARNYALRKATGDFIGFVDSDDLCELTMFESLLNAALKFQADISFGARSHWFVNRVVKCRSPVKHHNVISEKDYLQSVFSDGEWRSTSVAGGYVWQRLFKRHVVENIEFVDTKKCCEDELFCVLAGLKARTICVTDTNLVYYRQRQNSAIHEGLFALKTLKGRLEIYQVIQDEELRLVCERALIRALVSVCKYWRTHLTESDRKLLVDTAKVLYPSVKKQGKIRWTIYTWTLTRPHWLRELIFLIARSRKQKKRDSSELFD